MTSPDVPNIFTASSSIKISHADRRALLEIQSRPEDRAPFIRINRPTNGAMLVEIDSDGVVTYGEGYSPDEAAQVFWTAIGLVFPGTP